MTKKEWMNNLEYLPEFMRDFHDQKDLFKTIDEIYERFENQPNWRDAQIYTVDVFLWFMASRGYTLQKCRKKVEFKDIAETLLKHRDIRNSHNTNLINNFLSGGDND